MRSVCSNIDTINDSGIEVKYAESTIELLSASAEISSSSLDTLSEIFLVDSDFEIWRYFY